MIDLIAGDEAWLRAAAYGDGVFETMRIRQGKLPWLDRHLARLGLGLQRLGLDAMRDEIAESLQQLAQGWQQATGVLKLLAVASPSPRGYTRASRSVRWLVQFSELSASAQPIAHAVRCATRLGHQPLLAGIKHLNRLEQVLARDEAQTRGADEGLMFDQQGRLIAATAANVFVRLQNGRLLTPQIADCGIAGVTRAWMLEVAQHIGVEIAQRSIQFDDFAQVSSLCLTNAVTGPRMIACLEHIELATDDVELLHCAHCFREIFEPS